MLALKLQGEARQAERAAGAAGRLEREGLRVE